MFTAETDDWKTTSFSQENVTPAPLNPNLSLIVKNDFVTIFMEKVFFLGGEGGGVGITFCMVCSVMTYVHVLYVMEF